MFVVVMCVISEISDKGGVTSIMMYFLTQETHTEGRYLMISTSNGRTSMKEFMMVRPTIIC